MYNILIPIPIYHSTLTSPSTTLLEKDSSQQSPGSETKSVIEETGIEINLTVNDLLEAGYHNDRTPWSEEEDAKLLSFAKKNELTWNEIAEHFPERTPKMCYSRYRRITSQTKEPWRPSEDEKIKKFVEENGQKHWATLAL